MFFATSENQSLRAPGISLVVYLDIGGLGLRRDEGGLMDSTAQSFQSQGRLFKEQKLNGPSTRDPLKPIAVLKIRDIDGSICLQ